MANRQENQDGQIPQYKIGYFGNSKIVDPAFSRLYTRKPDKQALMFEYNTNLVPVKAKEEKRRRLELRKRILDGRIKDKEIAGILKTIKKQAERENNFNIKADAMAIMSLHSKGLIFLID